MSEHVAYLPYADYILPLCLYPLDDGLGGRGKGIVLPPLGPPESPGLSDERARYHAPDILFVEQLPRYFADPVEFLDRDDILVSRNLEDAVGGGIDDEASSQQVLLPELVYDAGA